MPRDAAEMATRWLACLARRVNNSDTLAAPRKPKQRSNRSEMKGSTALLPDRETAQSVNSPIGQYVRKGRFGPIDPKYYVIPYCDYVSILRRSTQITSASFSSSFSTSSPPRPLSANHSGQNGPLTPYFRQGGPRRPAHALLDGVHGERKAQQQVSVQHQTRPQSKPGPATS